MKCESAEFLMSAAALAQLPRGGLPEVALAGRSNVGKSSLLNALTGRRRLARISRTPGKTRLLNLYEIDRKLILVDLPGYGFARVPEAVKRDWSKLVESYLDSRDELRGIVHLVDARHAPTRDDAAMHDWIKHYRVRALIAATKVDKIPRGRRAAALKLINDTLAPDPATPVEFFSAVTGEGVRGVMDWVRGVVVRQPR